MSSLLTATRRGKRPRVIGELILQHRARRVTSRVDLLSRIYAYACGAFFVLSAGASIALERLGATQMAITLFVLSTGATGYLYSTLLAREMHVRDVTDRTIDHLRGRWDELRKDSELLDLLTGTIASDELTSSQRVRLRLYLATVFDMYSLIIYYLTHGYFREPAHFAGIYEEMLRSLLRHGHVVEVWSARDCWGPGALCDEYGAVLTTVVNELISELKSSGSLTMSAPPLAKRAARRRPT